MAHLPSEYSHLAEEIIELVLSKIQRLPAEDPALVVIAAIEAVAWIAATECKSFAREHNATSDSAIERAEEYAKLFGHRVHHDLSKIYSN